MKYGYAVLWNVDIPTAPEFEFETDWTPDEPEWAVVEAAEDFHIYHGGWESSWPLDIALFCEGKRLGVFTVEREYEPRFWAQRKANP